MLENIQFQLLLATFAGWVGRRQAAVITYLVEENRGACKLDAKRTAPEKLVP